MRVGLTSVFVDDHVQAEFCTQILGFPGQDQRPLRPDERWLTVVSPEEPE
jgi:hypothetical protein